MSKSFEDKMNLLEQVVKELESSNNDLEGSMKAFEKGIKLYNECNDILKAAENKIEVLNKNVE